MISERTMRSLKCCQETAYQVIEVLNSVLADINRFTMILKIKNNNLSQSKQEQASIHQINKYLKSEVYDPMMKKADAVKDSSKTLSQVQNSCEADIVAIIESYFNSTNELIATLNFMKKQLNNVNMSLMLHNASIKLQMTECVEKFGAIITKIDSIIALLHTQIDTTKDVLNSVKTS